MCEPVLKPMMIIWQVEKNSLNYQAEHERVRQWLEENEML
jgi:hypothetical protein